MARTRLTAAALAACLAVSTPAKAQVPVQPVFDEAVLAKTIEGIKTAKESLQNDIQQIMVLKQSLDFVTEISGFTQSLAKTIGEIGSLKLNIPNLSKIKKQLESDMQCLLPDGLDWGLDLGDLGWGTICARSDAYRKGLFLSEKEAAKLPIAEANVRRRTTAARRDALLADSASRSLAHADIAIKEGQKTGQAIDDLQTEADKAATLQQREAIALQAQILSLREQQRQTQILAQTLKLQAALAVKAGLGSDDVAAITDGGM